MKQAALIRDIRQRCNPGLQQKAQGIPVKLRRVDAKNLSWLFDVKGSKKPYRVRLKARVKGNVTDFGKADILVSCSCPFWQWQGPEYHAKQGGYLLGRPIGTASKPGQKDPSGRNGACKHVLAVLNFIESRKWRVPRSKRGSLRYLADIVATGEMYDDFSEIVDRVARRYLHQQSRR